MDYLLCGLLIFGLVALFGILVSACVLTVLDWRDVDVDEW